MKTKTKRFFRNKRLKNRRTRKNNRGGYYKPTDSYVYCTRDSNGRLLNPKCRSMTQDTIYAPLNALSYVGTSVGQSVGILDKPKPVQYSYYTENDIKQAARSKNNFLNKSSNDTERIRKSYNCPYGDQRCIEHYQAIENRSKQRRIY